MLIFYFMQDFVIFSVYYPHSYINSVVITMDKLTIGKRIKYERQRLGLTLEELGNQLGVSKQGLSGWEHGRNMPDIIALDKMAKIFSIDMKDFFLSNDICPAAKHHISNNNILTLTDKELLLINKFRSLTAEKRKAIEILFGIKDSR